MDDPSFEFDFSELFKTMAKRPLHRVITPELISAQSDEDIEIMIFDIAWAVKSPDRIQVLSGLPKGYSVVYPTMALEAEVSNGGFNQFFYNPTSQLYELAVDGYQKLQFPSIAALVEKANAKYKSEARNWRKAFQLLAGTLEGFFKSYKYSSLDSLDESMYSAKEDISKNRILFIRNNPQFFTGNFAHLYSTRPE